jgi:hypothetical protein
VSHIADAELDLDLGEAIDPVAGQGMFLPMQKTLAAVFLYLSIVMAGGSDSPYNNPLDGKNYRVVWMEGPEDKGEEGAGKMVTLAGVRLMSSQQSFDQNIDKDALEEYIESTRSNIEFVAGDPKDSFSLLLETTITPSERPKFAMASRGKAPDGALEKIYRVLGSLPDLRSKLDTLKYQLEFRISAQKDEDPSGAGSGQGQ